MADSGPSSGAAGSGGRSVPAAVSSDGASVAREDLQCGQLQPELKKKGGTFQQSARDTSLANVGTASKPYDGRANINSLPGELLIQIFSYMSHSENINILQNVCTQWKTLAQNSQLWKEYVIRQDTSEESAIAIFRAAPQLRAVVMEKVVSPAVLKALYRNCRNLTTLDISLQMISYPEAKKLFERCKQIQTLRISEIVLLKDHWIVAAVAQLPQLRVLRLKPFRSTGLRIPLAILASGCPQLTELDLGYTWYEAQGAELFISSRKHALKWLCIRWTSAEERCIVPLLTACANTLEHLDLKYYDITGKKAEEAFVALGQLYNLRELVLDTAHREVSHVAPLAFRYGGLSNLELLSLLYIHEVGNETMVAISEGCPLLRELSLVACSGLTDAAFQPLCKLRYLEKLKVSSCEWLGEEAIPYISNLSALRTLHFNDVRFETLEPGVDCFLDMTGLCHLYLSKCECSSIPFGRFPERLTNLRELRIEECDGDQDRVNEMATLMPKLKVVGSFGRRVPDVICFPPMLFTAHRIFADAVRAATETQGLCAATHNF